MDETCRGIEEGATQRCDDGDNEEEEKPGARRGGLTHSPVLKEKRSP